MGLVQLQNMTKQLGAQVVLRDVTLDLHTGQIAAFIGANGAGKTTLFKLITGDLTPDYGTVTRSKGLQIGYLSQEPDIAAGATLRDAVAEAFADLLALERRLHELSDALAAAQGPRLEALMAEYDRVNARFEAAGGYTFEQRLNEILGGLGFSPADAELPVSALSGGQKCRAALAKLLLQERQFLLLDEPTNHLDIDAVRWLEKFLAGHHGGAVIISHDRYLLDRVAQRTIEVAGAQVSAAPGNYSAFVRDRAQRRLAQQRQYEQDRAFIAKEQDYFARYGAAQRSAQAKGRLKRLERRLEAGEFVTERPVDEQALRLRFDAPDRAHHRGKEILRVEGLRKACGDKLLFDDLSLEVWAGQRLGITGPNGTGKTTLLRIILDTVAADAGQVRLNPTVRIGYFAQETADLDPQNTIVQEICAVRGDFLERDARHYAARFLFTGEEVFKRVGQLSGGEQARVRFMKLMLASPEVLFLDEPTNHLDIPAREALEAALAEFPGTVIVVSHDRYFLDRVAERLLVIRPTGHKLYGGNYSYYIEQVEQAKAAEAEQARRARPTRGGGGRAAATPAKQKSPWQKMSLQELETAITEREERLAALHARFGDPEVYKDAARVGRLRAEYEQLSAELAAAEAAWAQKVDAEAR